MTSGLFFSVFASLFNIFIFLSWFLYEFYFAFSLFFLNSIFVFILIFMLFCCLFNSLRISRLQNQFYFKQSRNFDILTQRHLNINYAFLQNFVILEIDWYFLLWLKILYYIFSFWMFFFLSNVDFRSSFIHLAISWLCLE